MQRFPHEPESIFDSNFIRSVYLVQKTESNKMDTFKQMGTIFVFLAKNLKGYNAAEKEHCIKVRNRIPTRKKDCGARSRRLLSIRLPYVGIDIALEPRNCGLPLYIPECRLVINLGMWEALRKCTEPSVISGKRYQ